MKKSKLAIETENLSISWGEVNVLNQLNFKLNEGDKLEFTLEDGPKGPSAVNLKKLD